MNAQAMPDPRGLQDDLLSAFEAMTLEPAQFSHRLHLELGWRYLQRDGFPQGAVKFCQRLRAYVAHVGAAGKYHETITWGYLMLMNEERTLRSPPGETFDALLVRRPDLLDHRGGALSKIYDWAQLEQADSRRVFQLPRRAAAAG